MDIECKLSINNETLSLSSTVDVQMFTIHVHPTFTKSTLFLHYTLFEYTNLQKKLLNRFLFNDTLFAYSVMCF